MKRDDLINDITGFIKEQVPKNDDLGPNRVAEVMDAVAEHINESLDEVDEDDE